MHQHAVRRIVVTIVAVTFALGGTVPGAAAQGDHATRCPSGQKALRGDICVARGSALGTEIVDAVRELVRTNPIRGTTFGVWVDGKAVLTGALGNAQPGVAATRQDHFRIGNSAETMMTTILLEMVEAGELGLDDPVAKFFPDLPEADNVTLRMLATSTSGYADFVTTAEFNAAFEADPFRVWEPAELIAIAMAQPTLFAPGTSWAFSDTNFVLLGEILTQASGKPYGKLIQSMIFDEVGMRSTDHTTTSAIPSPVLHAYSNERGNYEEATFWSPSWATYAATVTSNLEDMGKWARTAGEGTLLSRRSHELQVGDENVGLGPLTEETHYGMGVLITHDWILANPQLDGYTGVVSYLPSKKAAVVVSATLTDEGDIANQYAALIFNRIAEIVSPANAPNISVCPRGC